MPAQALDVAGDLSDCTALGALEEHVLVKMCEAFFAGPFVGRSDARPDLEFDDGRAMALTKQNRQSVRKFPV